MVPDSSPPPPARTPPTTPWARLASRAAQAPDAADASPPLGFTTRLLAQAAWPPRPLLEANPWHLRERFAWRGAWIAAGITMLTMAMNYDLLVGLWYGDTALAGSLLQAFAVP